MVECEPTAQTDRKNAAAAHRVHEMIEEGVQSGVRALNGHFVAQVLAVTIDAVQSGILLESTGLTASDTLSELGDLLLDGLSSGRDAFGPGATAFSSPGARSRRPGRARRRVRARVRPANNLAPRRALLMVKAHPRSRPPGKTPPHRSARAPVDQAPRLVSGSTCLLRGAWATFPEVSSSTYLRSRQGTGI